MNVFKYLVFHKVSARGLKSLPADKKSKFQEGIPCEKN